MTARAMPVARARCWSCRGSFPERMEIKITLSTPNTSSSATKVNNATQDSGFESQEKSNIVLLMMSAAILPNVVTPQRRLKSALLFSTRRQHLVADGEDDEEKTDEGQEDFDERLGADQFFQIKGIGKR